MKFIVRFLLVICIMFSFNIIAFGDDISPNDVAESHWAYAQIINGINNGVFSGYPDGTFRPDDNVTRAELIKVLTDFLGRKVAKPSETIFEDMDLEAWYAPYVNVSEYIIPESWKDEKMLKADKAVTREEVIYSIVVAMQYDYEKDIDLTCLKSFEDKEEISFGYDKYIALGIEFGVISGYPDKTIRPDANITRAEFACIMDRVSEFKGFTDERRERVADYMKAQTSLLWKSNEDFSYSLSSKGVPPEELTSGTVLNIVKDRVYQGVPYSYAAGDMYSFLEYSEEKDENGVYTISGLTWRDLSTAGGSTPRTARIGNDCGGSIQLALGSIGNPSSISGVTKLSPAHGYPRIGNYTTNDIYNDNKVRVSALEDKNIAYEAYSRMRKGDILVSVTNSWTSHCVMVESVDVVYDENGKIDPQKSTVAFLEQTKGAFLAERKYYNEELGCDVYIICNSPYVTTFDKLSGLPVTVEIFIDHKPIEKPVVTDSISEEYSVDNLFKGEIKCTWMIASSTITITDKSGTVVQKASILPVRTPEVQYNDSFRIKMTNFLTDNPGLISGEIDIDKLDKGKYDCTVSIRLVSNEEFNVRNFKFSK